MNIFLLLATAIFGGFGATLRFLLGNILYLKFGTANYFATAIINISGSFLLGVITGFVAVEIFSKEVALLFGTGFLGGYTTFSTASFETVSLVQEHRYVAAMVYSFGTLFFTILAAIVGVHIFRM